MPSRYSRLSNRIKDDNVRKELEKRSKSDNISVSQPTVNISPAAKAELTTVTSNDQSIDIVKEGNNYDLSVYRYIGGYETHFATQQTPDEPEVNGEEKLPINYAISDGWVPFIGELEIIQDKIGCFGHIDEKYYTQDLEFQRNMLYFKAPKSGVYRFETALFLTIGPNTEEEVTYCWPENYTGLTGNSRVNIDAAHLILIKTLESDIEKDDIIRPLENVVSLVDRYYNKMTYESDAEGWRKSKRYCSLRRTSTIRLDVDDIIIPMYHVDATQYRSSGGVIYVDPFTDSRTFFCQQLEYFYVQYCNDNFAENDNMALQDLINIISYYD